MDIEIRTMRRDDVEACGRIAYQAHLAVAAAHNVPPEQPSVEAATGMLAAKLQDANAAGRVAERDGRVVGSAFVNYFPPAPVAAIGPLTVHPSAEGGVGRRLMDALLDNARRRGVDSVRLVQSPSHLRSLALYTKLGFDLREPLVFVQGRPPGSPIAGVAVRAATASDAGACHALCVKVHGLARELELGAAIARAQATVAERAGRITGYAAGIGFRGHAVGETTGDVQALIAHAPAFLGPGFFAPARDGALLRWLLGAGLRPAWAANLMAMGRYQEPAGAFLPSIAF